MEQSMQFESVLKLDTLYFEKIQFDRIGNENDFVPTFSFVREIKKEQDGRFGIRLSALVEKKEEYTIDLKLVGVFNFEPTAVLQEAVEKELVEINSVAIMFPYLRSELTLLTAQPFMSPLTLPAMNIAALFEDAEGNNNN